MADVKCNTCKGRKVVDITYVDSFGNRQKRTGVKCTTCGGTGIMWGQTAISNSIDNMNKGLKPKSEGGNCFVATAVYEDANHPNVRALQNFRDSKLVKTGAGRLFVDFYYFIGPSIGRFVNKVPVAKKLLRFIFDLSVHP